MTELEQRVKELESHAKMLQEYLPTIGATAVAAGIAIDLLKDHPDLTDRFQEKWAEMLDALPSGTPESVLDPLREALKALIPEFAHYAIE